MPETETAVAPEPAIRIKTEVRAIYGKRPSLEG